MKRFYKRVDVVSDVGGYGIALDGRPVRTPKRASLIVPYAKLADAIAAEWQSQGEDIDPRSMMMTGLANAAIDHVVPDPTAFAAGISAYGASDLLCYRADAPAPLVARQNTAWNPLLDWARARYDIDFALVTGIMYQDQSEASLVRLADVLAARTSFALAGLSPLVTISGSLIAALALADGGWDAETIWHAVTVDERWQAEQWGSDALAEQAQNLRHRDFQQAAMFLTLLD